MAAAPAAHRDATPLALSPVAVLACVCYAGASTLVTLLNKIVFSHSRFHYPWTTLAVQNLLSVFLIMVGNVLGMTPAGTYSRKVARDMSIPIVCFVFFIFTNAQSMRHINIPVLTVWKSLGPMFVTLFERFYFNDVFSPRVYVAMLLIVLSALVTAINDLEYSAVGYFWAASNVFANVAYLASLRIYLRSPHVSALDKTFHSNLLSLVPIAALAVISGETPLVISDFHATDLTFKLVFALSGFLTTAVCATAFWTISLTNGSTLSFIGGLNKIPMILLSLLMFETNMTLAGWAGVLLGVLAGIVFMRAKTVSASIRGTTSQKAAAAAVTSSSAPAVAAHNGRHADIPIAESTCTDSQPVGSAPTARHPHHHHEAGSAAAAAAASATMATSAPAVHAPPPPQKLSRTPSFIRAVLGMARRNVGFTGVEASSGE